MTQLPDPTPAANAAWQRLGQRWRWYCEDHEARYPGTPYPDLIALFEAASAEPGLRRLCPYTSHFALCFSSTPRYPWKVQAGAIDPLFSGRFRVIRRRPTALLAETRTAEEAVALTAGLLTPGPDPAIRPTHRPAAG
jgi:hypothetical protein